MRHASMLSRALIAGAALLCGSPAVSGPGEFDLSFGNRGWLDIPQLDWVSAVVPLPDGSVVVAGSKWPSDTIGLVNPQPDALALRVSADGATLWTRRLGFGNTVAARRMANGRILVAHTAGTSRITALREDGAIDPAFGEQGSLNLDKTRIVTGAGSASTSVFVQSIRELPDGDVLISASVTDDTIPTAWDPATLGVLFRISADGRLRDPASPAVEVLRQRFPAGTEVLPDGRGLVVATPGCCAAPSTVVLARDLSGGLSPTLTLDAASTPEMLWYGSDAALTVDTALQRFYVRGVLNSSPTVLALDAAGAPDASFGSTGTGAIPLMPHSGEGKLLVDGGGRVVAVSPIQPPSTGDIARIAMARAAVLAGRWNAAGAPDPKINASAVLPVADSRSRSRVRWLSVSGANTGYAWIAATVADSSGERGHLGRLQLGDGSGRGTVGFQLASIRVAEGGPRVAARVTRSGGHSGAVSVRYDIVTPSATDLEPVSGILNWPDGDASPRSIEIAAPDDLLLEAERSQVLRLFDPGGGVDLADASLTVTIEDDEALALLSANASGVQISAGQEARFTVTVDRPLPGPVSVIALIGDAVDATGLPRYVGRNTSGWRAQTLAWEAGATGTRSVSLPTNTNTEPGYTADLHLRLLTETGVLARTTGGGPTGAHIKVVAAAELPGATGNPGTTSPAATPPSPAGTQGGGATGPWSLGLLLLGLLAKCNALPRLASVLNRARSGSWNHPARFSH